MFAATWPILSIRLRCNVMGVGVQRMEKKVHQQLAETVQQPQKAMQLIPLSSRSVERIVKTNTRASRYPSNNGRSSSLFHCGPYSDIMNSVNLQQQQKRDSPVESASGGLQQSCSRLQNVISGMTYQEDDPVAESNIGRANTASLTFDLH